MEFTNLHSWNLTPKEAISLQKELAEKISLSNTLIEPIKTVAGIDVSYRKWGNLFHAAVVVLDYQTMETVETASASGDVSFPYVPGLLSFRELPIVLQAFKRLKQSPDVILVDGHGIAHPRRLGLASHLGLWVDLPTIGCAKSLLCGQYDEPGESRGVISGLFDSDERVGTVVRTKDRVKPVFVSPGHKVDVQMAAGIVLRCNGGYRLPEPTRQAHLLSNKTRAEFEASVE